MEKTIIKLEQYNEDATKAFVLECLKIMPLPQFVQMYCTQDWKGAYETLKVFSNVIPIVVEIYNMNYNKILIRNN